MNFRHNETVRHQSGWTGKIDLQVFGPEPGQVFVHPANGGYVRLVHVSELEPMPQQARLFDDEQTN